MGFRSNYDGLDLSEGKLGLFEKQESDLIRVPEIALVESSWKNRGVN